MFYKQTFAPCFYFDLLDINRSALVFTNPWLPDVVRLAKTRREDTTFPHCSRPARLVHCLPPLPVCPFNRRKIDYQNFTGQTPNHLFGASCSGRPAATRTEVHSEEKRATTTLGASCLGNDWSAQYKNSPMTIEDSKLTKKALRDVTLRVRILTRVSDQSSSFVSIFAKFWMVQSIK